MCTKIALSAALALILTGCTTVTIRIPNLGRDRVVDVCVNPVIGKERCVRVDEHNLTEVEEI